MNGGVRSCRIADAPPPRRGDEGFVLLFVLFVIVVIIVVTGQLSFSSSVDRQIARNTVQELQMENLAHGAILRGAAALLTDLDDDSKGGGDGTDPMGGGGGPTSGGGPADGGSAPDNAGSKQKNQGPHVDSLDESWASGQITMQLGEEGGYQTRILITDEDAKLNLLLLLTEDEDYRKLWRTRFERAIDLMRDGQPQDLTNSDASDYLDRFTSWMQGDRQNDELSLAPLATGIWKNGGDRSNYPPFSLREFTLTGDVNDALYYGFPYGKDEDRKWVPGLEQTLTVWSNLEFKDATTEENEKNAQQNVDPSVDAKPKDRPEAAGMNNGRLNVNTAPIWVLKSLFSDSEIATSAWDDYEEFRKKTLDEKKKERDNFNGDDSSTSSTKDKAEPGPTDPIYPLKTIDDLRRFKGFAPEGGIAPDVWNKLAELLSVESNVFTITVLVGTTELPRRFYVARSVVWRKGGGADQPCIPIVRFEKLPLSAVDLDAFAKELDSFSGGN
jgi:hypothetical protein